ncbi:MAG: alpha/beta fold hydrolase [Steroidobacteraceae bacterium]
MLAVLGVAAHSLAAQAQPSLVDVGGHRLNVQVTGTSKPGVPTVVFEGGLGSPLAAWNGVHLTIADSVRTIAYERAGIGASEPASGARPFKGMVAELHALLEKVGAAPPYVLVGHSLGGALINLFAATFPREVAGLVHIDPTDFTQTEADLTALWEILGVQGLDSGRKLSAQMMTRAPAAVQAERREYDRVERGGFAEFRAAGVAPDVPIVVLLGTKADPAPPGIALPANYDRFWRAASDQRMDHFSRLAARASRGTLVITSKSGHFIHVSEPELAVWAIRRVISAATPHPELERFVGQYQLAPSLTIAITREDDKLLLQATGQNAFAMAQETPTTFSVKMVGAVIEFEIDATGNVTGLVLVQNGARQRAPKAR